jgi:Zn-dependent protease
LPLRIRARRELKWVKQFSLGDGQMYIIFSILWIRLLEPIIVGMALGVLAMMLHECGHLAAATALRVRVKRVGIQWNRGLFTVREQGTVRQNLLIALAGPVANLLLTLFAPWFPLFSLANVCCVLANLLPIEGSDGYRVAGCLRRIREGEPAH